MSETEISNVSDTALWVAVYRAEENERPDALFRDPYAARLAGEKGLKIASQATSGKYTRWTIVVRTYVIDAFIQDLIAKGIDTVINLGCGLDTRPYRMNLPKSLRWIEVDYPHIIQLKEQKLAGEVPRCQLQRIGLDLAVQSKRQELFKTLAAATSNALIITEGVVPYLTVEQTAELAKDLRMHTSFRHWIVEYFTPEVVARLRGSKLRKQMKNAPFQFAPDDWVGFFKSNGWEKEMITYLAEEGDKLGRPFPLPFWFKLISPIIPAAKREAIKKMTAYTVLKPN